VVVVAHPDPGSLTRALAQAAVNAAGSLGVHARLQDLYADGFDPRMPAAEVGTTEFADELTARYAAEVLAADVLVFVHPVWFFHLPAMLKGWVDRVLRDGVAYEVVQGGATRGLLRARAALVVNTANSGPAAEAYLGDPLERFWRDVVLGPAGVSEVQRVRCAPVHGSEGGQRDAWLEEVGAAVSAMLQAPAGTLTGGNAPGP